MSESICSLPNDECLLYRLAGHTTNSLSGYGECLITGIALFTCNYTPVKSHKIREVLTKTHFMLSPSVTGHGLHRLGLKSIEVKLKSNEAKPSWTST